VAVLFFVKNNIELKKDLSEKIAEKIDKERYSKNKHSYDFAKAFYVLGSVFKQFMAPALVVLIVLVLASALKNIPLNTSKPGLGSGTEEGLEEITIEGGDTQCDEKEKGAEDKVRSTNLYVTGLPKALAEFLIISHYNGIAIMGY
jgi:hypothetical protein